MALADVYILPTDIKGPAQLAVYLAQIAKRKDNPIVHAVILYVDSNNMPGIAWSELTNADLLQLQKFLEIVNDDIFREEWYDVLFHPEEEDEEA